MKSTKWLVIVAALWFASSALSAQEPSPRTQPRTQPAASTQAQIRGTAYQRRGTWYDFLLKQFNRDNLDYGAWMEQRRKAFLEGRVRNPYFGYSFTATLGLLLMAAVCTKLWIDNRRTLWVTAEMMADIYNHDLLSRGIAKEAIRKYNEHIDSCNRAIEGNGALPGGADGGTERLKAELLKTGNDLAEVKRDKTRIEEELQTKSGIIAELSLRLDSLKRPGSNSFGPQQIDLRDANPNLVKHINDLQQQLYAEQKKNRQLKGA